MKIEECKSVPTSEVEGASTPRCHEREEAARTTERATAIIFVGSVLPDSEEFVTDAYSRAGTLFQRNLLASMHDAGLSVSEIISFRHVRAFPGSKCLWAQGERVDVGAGLSADLLPFVNVTIVKEALLGFQAFARILKWGWRHRRRKQKVLLLYNLTVPPGVCSFVASRIVGARLIAVLADINRPGQTIDDGLLARLDFRMQSWLIPRCDGHMPFAADIMSDFAPGRSYLLMDGGFQPEWAEKSRAARERRRADRFTLGFAGKLSAENGVRLLLETFRSMNGRRFRLVIAGAGPLAEEIQAAARSDDRIVFRGFRSHDEVLSLYGEVDVLLNLRLTSEIDTRYFFPSKLLECLGSGTPVISTRTGHVEAELARYLYVLSEESPRALGELIRQVSATEGRVRESLGEAAKAYVLMHKTWSVQGLRVAEYVRGVCGAAVEDGSLARGRGKPR